MRFILIVLLAFATIAATKGDVKIAITTGIVMAVVAVVRHWILYGWCREECKWCGSKDTRWDMGRNWYKCKRCGHSYENLADRPTSWILESTHRERWRQKQRQKQY